MMTDLACHCCKNKVEIVGGTLHFCQSKDCDPQELINDTAGDERFKDTPACLRLVVCNNCHSICDVCKKHFCKDSLHQCYWCANEFCSDHEQYPCYCGLSESQVCPRCVFLCHICVAKGNPPRHQTQCSGDTLECVKCKKLQCSLHTEHCYECNIALCFLCVEENGGKCTQCAAFFDCHKRTNMDCPCSNCLKEKSSK